MKRIFWVSTLSLFLSGCWMHYNDPRPPSPRASVTTINNNVCVTIEPEGDEEIVTVRIDEVGNDTNGLAKYDLGIPALKGKCVADFGYKFEAGKSYNFMIILESPTKRKKGERPHVRIYGANFSLLDNDGKLNVRPF